jgi:hypothetical protein
MSSALRFVVRGAALASLLIGLGGLGNAPITASEFFHWDTFDAPSTFGQNWQSVVGPGTAEVASGDLLLSSNGITHWEMQQVLVTDIEERSDWSFRASVTPRLTESGHFGLAAFGVSDLRHAGIQRTQVRAARQENPVRSTRAPFGLIDTPLMIQMDAFGDLVKTTVWRPNDPEPPVFVELPNIAPTSTLPRIALWDAVVLIHDVWISSRSIPIVPGDFDLNGQLDLADLDMLNAVTDPKDLYFDLDGNSFVNAADAVHWVKDLNNTWIGDANLDGEFNSTDMVHAFQAGKYESADAASWGEGDWNFDQRFDSTDFVAAFQDGGYELGARPSVVGVPEPQSIVLLLIGGLCLRRARRHRLQLRK